MNIELKIQFNLLTFLLGLNLFVFLLAFIANATVGFDTSLFYVFGGQISAQIRAGDWWLLLTPNFFHIDIIHFLFNFISLYRIGQLILYYYDAKKLFFTYIFGGIAGVWLSYLISLLTGQNVLSLGASASIFALIGLLLGGTFKKYRYGQELPFSTSEILPFVVIAFLFGVMPGLNINNWAHLGGLGMGIILGFLVPNSLSVNKTKTHRILVDSLFWASVIIFVISYAVLLIKDYTLLML